MEISTKLIDPPLFLMRPVKTYHQDFLYLRDSIKEYGILQPLLVREKGSRYELIAGLHRLTAAKQLKLETVPCEIVEADDVGVLVLQVQENCQRKKTSNIELAIHLKTLLKKAGDMSLERLATLLKRPPHWVKSVLTLDTISGEVRPHVEKQPLSKLIELAKLPKNLQPEYAELCKTMNGKEFKQRVQLALKQTQEELVFNRRKKIYEDIELQPNLRTKGQIQKEIDNPVFFMLNEKDGDTLKDAWIKALKWSLHLDEASKKNFIEKMKREEKKRQTKLTKANYE